jgi:hypothetical protein
MPTKNEVNEAAMARNLLGYDYLVVADEKCMPCSAGETKEVRVQIWKSVGEGGTYDFHDRYEIIPEDIIKAYNLPENQNYLSVKCGVCTGKSVVVLPYRYKLIA